MNGETAHRRWTWRPFTKKAVVLALGICLVLVVASYYGLLFWIDSRAEATGAKASQKHPGDKVEALIALIESEEHSLEEKNRAIWALGRFRDPRAIHALQALYTGEPCDHERCVCQYELEKALANCKGERFDPIFWR